MTLLHLIHHSVSARYVVSVIALAGLYAVLKCVEYTFCGD
jgi:hypothetical protein